MHWLFSPSSTARAPPCAVYAPSSSARAPPCAIYAPSLGQPRHCYHFSRADATNPPLNERIPIELTRPTDHTSEIVIVSYEYLEQSALK